MFDFVVCSHTLEDIRDPIRACKEIMRIGKAGYIETPSRLSESVRGTDGTVGATHHRWLVTTAGNRLEFRHKPHHLHSSASYFVPESYLLAQPPEARITYLFWEGSFEAEEVSGYEYYSEAAHYIASQNIPKHFYRRDSLEKAARPVKNWLRAHLRRSGAPAKPSGDVWTWDRLFEANKEYLPQR